MKSLAKTDLRDPAQTHLRCLLCRRWYRAITGSHLEARHGIDAQAYKDKFGLRLITAGEVREKVAQSKILVGRRQLDLIRRAWKVKEQREIAARLGVDPATVRAWAKKLGLPPRVETWDRPKIVAGIRAARRRKIPLHSGAARRLLPRLYKAAQTHFASWGKAIRAAGLRYTRIRRVGPFAKWSADRIKDEIRRLLRKKRVGYKYLERHHSKLYAAARNYFGSWKRALRAALN